MNLKAEEVPQACVDADVVVFASLGEGFGLPIPEAQAMGRHLVTGAPQPMKDIPGASACVIDPFLPDDIRRAVLEIIHDQGYRESIVANGLKNAHSHTSEAPA